MKILTLLPAPMISFCSVPTVEHNILAENETLYIYLKQPIMEVEYIVVEPEEINWYDIYNE